MRQFLAVLAVAIGCFVAGGLPAVAAECQNTNTMLDVAGKLRGMGIEHAMEKTK